MGILNLSEVHLNATFKLNIKKVVIINYLIKNHHEIPQI